MSKALGPSTKFTHLNDCKQEGCPGHTMQLIYNCSTDQQEVHIDGKCEYIFDDNTWNALVELGEKKWS